MRRIRDLYCTIFLLICRVSGGGPAESSWTGALGVSMLQIFIGIALVLWFQKLSGVRIVPGRVNRLWGIPVFASILGPTYWFLVLTGRGARFQQYFSALSAAERSRLSRAAVLTVLAIMSFVFFTFYAATPPPLVASPPI
jgi:hypothetical protein